MAENLDRRDAIVLLGMLLVAACGGSKSRSKGPAATTAHGPTTTARTTPPTFVRGSNSYLTEAVLRSDAESYNGRWLARWIVGSTGEHGTIDGTVRVDPVARNFKVKMTVHGPLLGGTKAVPPLAVVVDADSFTYNEVTGGFSIRSATAIGEIHLQDDGGFGQFVLKIAAIKGRSDVRSFTANGVANRPDTIPVNFRVTRADGKTRDGILIFHPTKL
jgi:hypothetical protein